MAAPAGRTSAMAATEPRAPAPTTSLRRRAFHDELRPSPFLLSMVYPIPFSCVPGWNASGQTVLREKGSVRYGKAGSRHREDLPVGSSSTQIRRASSARVLHGGD